MNNYILWRDMFIMIIITILLLIGTISSFNSSIDENILWGYIFTIISILSILLLILNIRALNSLVDIDTYIFWRNIIIISMTGILLISGTITAFNSSTNMDFGLTRIITAFTSLFFIFACLAYYFSKKLSAFFFILFCPVFLLFMTFGNDIPIIIRLLCVYFYCRWGYGIFIKNNIANNKNVLQEKKA